MTGKPLLCFLIGVVALVTMPILAIISHLSDEIAEQSEINHFCSECKAFHLKEGLSCEENKKQVEEKIGYWKEKLDKGHISEAKFYLETADYLKSVPKTK